jgi:hypothetical protein
MTPPPVCLLWLLNCCPRGRHDTAGVAKSTPSKSHELRAPPCLTDDDFILDLFVFSITIELPCILDLYVLLDALLLRGVFPFSYVACTCVCVCVCTPLRVCITLLHAPPVDGRVLSFSRQSLLLPCIDWLQCTTIGIVKKKAKGRNHLFSLPIKRQHFFQRAHGVSESGSCILFCFSRREASNSFFRGRYVPCDYRNMNGSKNRQASALTLPRRICRYSDDAVCTVLTASQRFLLSLTLFILFFRCFCFGSLTALTKCGRCKSFMDVTEDSGALSRPVI